MPNILRYDPDADAMYVRVSSRHAWESLEINHNLNIDLDRNGKVVGVELLDVRRFVKRLFGHSVEPEAIKDLKIRILSESKQELVLDMRYSGERIRYAIPSAYTSPLVSISG